MFAVSPRASDGTKRCSRDGAAHPNLKLLREIDFIASQDPHKSAAIDASARGLNLSGPTVREAGESTIRSEQQGRRSHLLPLLFLLYIQSMDIHEIQPQEYT